MKDEILQDLTAVLDALGNVYVHGKDNLGNLVGSICVIEKVAAMVKVSEITEIASVDDTEKK